MQTKMKMKKKIGKSSDYGLKLNFEENQQVKKKKKKSAWVGGGKHNAAFQCPELRHTREKTSSSALKTKNASCSQSVTARNRNVNDRST